MIEYIEKAKNHFENIIREQIERVELIKKNNEFIDFSKLNKIIIGIVPGDGIGPYIAEQAERVLKFLLKDEISNGKIEF